MKYKYIAFDIDGTLLDTEYAVLHSLQETILTLSQREILLEELVFALGITGADALKSLGIENVFAALNLWNQNMCKYTSNISVFDGIVELLQRLLKQDCEIGIITSKTREEYENDFCRFGISRYFQTIVCADDTKEHKPNAAPLLKYMELSGADCGQMLYIGDSEYDSLSARNSGTDFALAVWGSKGRQIKADYYLKKPLDLMNVILC